MTPIVSYQTSLRQFKYCSYRSFHRLNNHVFKYHFLLFRNTHHDHPVNNSAITKLGYNKTNKIFGGSPQMTATQKALALAKQTRIEIKASDDQRDAGLPLTIPEVERFDNIAYGPANPGHLLDIYLPKQRTNLVPIIINIHGGGWFYGTKETYQFYGMSLAKQGFGVVNFNYRLPPEAEFPDELADVDRAFH